MALYIMKCLQTDCKKDRQNRQCCVTLCGAAGYAQHSTDALLLKIESLQAQLNEQVRECVRMYVLMW